MWNRRGERLRVADHLTQAIGQLRSILPGAEWLDCEARERRHALGRGTLIVLDLVVPDLGYEARREILGSALPVDQTAFCGDCPEQMALLVPSVPDRDGAAMALYQSLKDQNRRLGCDFFKGVVMKRAGSPYPIQRRSATQTFPGCSKIHATARDRRVNPKPRTLLSCSTPEVCSSAFTRSDFRAPPAPATVGAGAPNARRQVGVRAMESDMKVRETAPKDPK